MSWQQVILIILFCFAGVSTVSKIGEPRKPIAPNEAVIVLLLDAILILLVATI
jgi:hypothetical protein